MNKTSPFSPDSAIISIAINANVENNIPEGLLVFKMNTETDPTLNPGSKYITEGEFIFSNRISDDSTCSYDITPNVTKIYYNEKKEITRIQLFEYNIEETDEEDEDESLHPKDNYEDIVTFFKIIKDEQALSAFRMLSWYWTCFGLGFSILHSIEKGNISPPTD